MYSLSACNRDLLKVRIAMFSICHLISPLNVLKNAFNFIIYVLEKNSPSPETVKQMC